LLVAGLAAESIGLLNATARASYLMEILQRTRRKKKEESPAV
jgi:hypothetical protein